MILFKAASLLLLPIGAVSAFKSRSIDIDAQFSVSSKAGKDLIASSRLVNGSRSLEDFDYDFVGRYSIKFQDCHSVNQWDGENNFDDEEKGNAYRIIPTNLVRFRLCPSTSCSHATNSGCSSRYGDYLVDLNTFVYNYLTAMEALNDDINDYCYSECFYDDDCMDRCFEKNGGNVRNTLDDDGVLFDPLDYSTCSQFGEGEDIFIGPYCSSDGKSINLGVFSDDSCNEFSSCDDSCFQSTYGYYLPYTDSSMVQNTCVSCAYDYINQRYDNNNYQDGASSVCKNLYSNAGKCETKMSIDYPNESACRYIQGIKFLRKDGVISSNSVKRSKGASMAIGLVSFTSILLAVYVHYLSLSESYVFFQVIFSLFFSINKLIYFFPCAYHLSMPELYRARFNLRTTRAVL